MQRVSPVLNVFAVSPFDNRFDMKPKTLPSIRNVNGEFGFKKENADTAVKLQFCTEASHPFSELGTTIPVGYGLGSSGAVALSLAFALNKALGTNLSRTKIGQIAHNAEIHCKTGLGTVLSSYHGGFEIRTKHGAPGIGSLQKIHTDYTAVVICFSPISTKQFIKTELSKINGLGGKMVTKLLKSRDQMEFLDMSLEFARYVDVITPQMQKVIDDLSKNGFKSGVAMFGETVFTLVPKTKESHVMQILKKYDGLIIKTGIDKSGARVS